MVHTTNTLTMKKTWILYDVNGGISDIPDIHCTMTNSTLHVDRHNARSPLQPLWHEALFADVL